MLNLFLAILIWGCQTPSKDVDWLLLFESDPQGTLLKLSESSPEQSELVGIQLLQNFPDSASIICASQKGNALQTQCQRFMSRPHLSTIKPEAEQELWMGGSFDTRIFFPKTIDRVVVNPQCQSDENACIERSLQDGLKAKSTSLINAACSSYSTIRGQSDCFFRTSEAWVKRYGGYTEPVELCRWAGAYAGECHHHLLLALAVRHQSSEKHHLQLIEEFKSYWTDYPKYSAELTQLYWAIVSSRVTGVIQPFIWSEWAFLPKEHVHSALGLRLIRDAQPLIQLEILLELEKVRLEKAYGPGTEFFKPKQVWPSSANPQLYFCDIRGGRRPVGTSPREDILIALMSAAVMLSPPNKRLIQIIGERFPELSDRAAFLLNEH